MPDLSALVKAGIDSIYAATGISVLYRATNGWTATVTAMGPYDQDRGSEELGRPTRPPERGRIMAVRISEVPEPGKGDKLTISSGADAGTWTVMSIESNDRVEAVLVVRT